MNKSLALIKELVQQNKFRKALNKIKKLNHKIRSSNYELLELESACLFNEKRYPLAAIKLRTALNLASEPNQKLNTLRNLVAIHLKLQQPQKAICYLIDYLEIDKSVSSRHHQYHLINLALVENDFKVVEKYAPSLINITEYSMFALTTLIKVGLYDKNREYALKYLYQADGEIRAEGSLEASFEDMLTVINGYHTLGELKREAGLISFLEQKYSHETWLLQVKARLSKKNEEKVMHSIGAKPKSNSNKKTRSPDARVLGSCPKTVKVIENLLMALESMGAKFHAGLSIIETHGEVSVQCSLKISKPTTFMEVPFQCMPLKSDYRYSLDKNGTLNASVKKTAVNPSATPIMKLLVEFYNVTNKISKWKSSFPLFKLAGHHQLIAKLLKAKGTNSKYHGYYFSAEHLISEEAIINSFFGSRVFNFNKDNFRGITKKFKKKSMEGFIPVIELINHRMGATGFLTDKTKQSMMIVAQPGDADQEVFVQYNLDDPLITFLTYGFVDLLAPWIYSVPMEFQTPHGLRIILSNAVSPASAKTLPEDMRSIAQYIPGHVERKGDVVFLSSLIIPGSEHIHTLKAVILHILSKVDFEGCLINNKILNQEAEFMEIQLIERNYDYWKGFNVENKCNENTLYTTALNQLNALCQFNLAHLENYIRNTGLSLKNI